MATIKQIAQRTGVSTATVSNVLNGKPGAASEAKTREILETAKSLNYTPNLFAKNLKQRKSNNIGIITEDLTVFNTPEIVDGVDTFCEEQEYEIILGNLRLHKRFGGDYSDTEAFKKLLDAMVRNMLSKQVEGIVYVGCHCREITFMPPDIHVPYVFAYCYPDQEQYPSVLFDDEKAAYDVTSLLVKRGHKNIGVVAGPLASFHTQARLRGYQRALYDAGLLYNANNVLYGDWESKSGYRAAPEMLKAGVSAVFAFNDNLASGIYEYCLENGLAIGRDLALFGFDNREISHGYSPRISTVAPPLHQIGQRAAQLVFDGLGRKNVPHERIVLPCDIHLRGSVNSLV